MVTMTLASGFEVVASKKNLSFWLLRTFSIKFSFNFSNSFADGKLTSKKSTFSVFLLSKLLSVKAILFA